MSDIPSSQNKIIGWLPAVAWMVMIVSLSLMPGSSVPSLKVPYIDKLVHFGFYLVLAALLLHGFWKQYNFEQIRFKFVLYALTISLLWGTLIEIFQYSLTNSRHFEYLDILANIIGSLTGLGAYLIYFSSKKG